MTETPPTPTAPASAPQSHGRDNRRPGGFGGRGRGPRKQTESEALGLTETVVSINRVSKTVKGGKRFSFGALVVVGDKKGQVGCGLGKSKDIQFAIQKGGAAARKSMIRFPIVRDTIPHETIGSFGAGKVWMKPAAPGTGVIAGSGVRAVLEAAGIKNILTKSLGSNNHFSMVYATLEALETLRSKEAIFKLRGKS
ncbi:MAG: 30S ribosomal protein S5 [Elusimicrobia bacterium]|nr:30S ribosomal protein S5 [Elusimicrobiota bacterium]